MASQPTQSNKPNKNRPRHSRPIEMLPDPSILESYDYVVEGAAEQILEMFRLEQQHRHEWEKRALQSYTISSVLGQVLGFIIAISVFTSAAVIGLYGDSAIAAFVWVFGMSIIMMSGLVWTYAKSMGQRPLFGRPSFRRHFRAEKEEEES